MLTENKGEFVSSGEKKIYCVYNLPPAEEFGEGPYPAMILATGYGGSLEENLNCAERYAKAGFAVCSLDFCGGSPDSKSSGSTRDMSIMTQKEDMLAVFEAVSGKPFVRKDRICLWGESQGGVIAALCAAQLRERVWALVLFYPAFSIFDEVHAFFGNREEVTDFLLWDMEVGKRYFLDIWDRDSEAVLKEIGAYQGPVLILHGTEDEIVPIAYSEKTCRAYRNADYRTIPGAGHGFYDETGERADEMVAEWLAVN